MKLPVSTSKRVILSQERLLGVSEIVKQGNVCRVELHNEYMCQNYQIYRAQSSRQQISCHGRKWLTSTEQTISFTVRVNLLQWQPTRV